MTCLVLVLTDEHPEIRSYIINQRLNLLFNKPLILESPILQGITIADSNDYLAMVHLFDTLTTEAS